MNIIVLVKQVPNTTDVKLDKKTGNLIREGLDSIMNPDDRHALELAVTLKDKLAGNVCVVSMGPAQAIDVISEAMGLGADRGFLLSDRAFAGADTWATSHTLGKAIEKIGDIGLVLCGRQAIDGDTAQIGPQVAAYLGMPQVTYVNEVEKAGQKKATVKRRLENGYERIECILPAVLTVIREINTPRYPDMTRLIDSCRDKAPIKIWNAADINVTVNEVGLEGSLTHVIKTYAPEFSRQGEILEGEAPRVVATLIEKMDEKNLI